MRRILGSLALLALLLALIAACAHAVKETERPKGVYHQVKKGETLWSISRAYKVSVQDIAEMNNITEPAQIKKTRSFSSPMPSAQEMSNRARKRHTPLLFRRKPRWKRKLRRRQALPLQKRQLLRGLLSATRVRRSKK